MSFMSKRRKTVLVIIIAAVIAGAPYIINPCDFGTVVPLSLKSVITGFSSKTGSGISVTENKLPVQSVSDSFTVNDEKRELMPALIELGSERCLPCRMMEPVIEKVKDQYKEKLKIIVYDVMTGQGKFAADTFGVKVIPTQVFLDNKGREYYRHQGYLPFEEVEKILNRNGIN